MKKTITSFLLALVISCSVSVLFLSAYSVKNDDYVNADKCYLSSEIIYDVDANGHIRFTTDNWESASLINDYAVDKIAFFDNELYASSGRSIYKISSEGKEKVLASDSEISSFSISESKIYYLSNGKIKTDSLLGFPCLNLIKNEGITDFWLEDNNKLCFMTDDCYIHCIDLFTMKERLIVNNKSSLDLSLYESDSESISAFNKSRIGLNSLKDKFPSDAYWNHVGSSYNNPDGYTYSPCTHHNGGCSYSGSCGCNSFSSCIQCMGFAFKCGYDITGSNPNTQSGGWKKYTSSSYIDSVKAGDIVRSNGHSMYIIGVDGNTVTVAECNWGRTCQIGWGRTVSKSTLRSSFENMYVSPFGKGFYTLKLDANEGECSSSSVYLSNGEPIGTLPIPYRDGYEFIGWYTDSVYGVKITNDTVFDYTKMSIIYAHWKSLKQTITYNPNSADDEVKNIPDSQIKDFNKSIYISSASPSRVGYKFLGWSTDPDAVKPEYKKGEVYKENEDLNLYAVWEAEKKAVLFYNNDGTYDYQTVYYFYGSPYGKLPVPERTGYDFVGWFTDKSGGDLITEDTIHRFASSVKLYAHWEDAKYYIYYDFNGGYSGPSRQAKIYNNKIILSNTVPRKYGFEFLGWALDSSPDYVQYLPGESYSANEDLFLIAVWQREKYTISFDLDGGFGPFTSVSKEYDIDYVFSSVMPEKSGYTFKYWLDTNSNIGKTYSVNSRYTENYETVFKAVWEPNKYSVTFEPNGSSEYPLDKVYTYNEKYNSLPSISRTGYIFEGWTTEKNEGDLISAEDIVYLLNDSTFYACWKPVEYDIKFNPVSGSCDSDKVKVKYGAEVSDLPDAYLADYVFCGWYTEDDELISENTIYSYDHNIELFARFIPSLEDDGVKTARFVADGNVIDDVDYLSLTDVMAPDIPIKSGYSASWAYSEESDYGVMVFADYIPETVKLKIKSGDSSDEYDYAVNSAIIPFKCDAPDGYAFIGYYPEIPAVMPSHGFETSALFEPLVYKADFVADGKIVSSVDYTVEDNVLSEIPDLPSKTGYTASWENYSIKSGGIKINAVFKPIVYSATFIASDDVIATVPFTVETIKLEEPDVPAKRGYSGKWEKYIITASDISINAIYERDVSIEILGYKPSVKVDYWTSVVFLTSFDTEMLDDSLSIHWFVNGVDCGADKDGSFTLNKVESTTKVQAKIFEDNKVIEESNIEKVIVNKSFFKKISAFFKMIFRKLPVVYCNKL